MTETTNLKCDRPKCYFSCKDCRRSADKCPFPSPLKAEALIGLLRDIPWMDNLDEEED